MQAASLPQTRRVHGWRRGLRSVDGSRRALQVLIPGGLSLSGRCRHAASESRHDKDDSPCPPAAPPGPLSDRWCISHGEVASQRGTPDAHGICTVHTRSRRCRRPRPGSAGTSLHAHRLRTTPPSACSPTFRLYLLRRLRITAHGPTSRSSSFPQGSSPRGPSTQASLPASILDLGAVLRRPSSAHSRTRIRTSHRLRVCCRARHRRDCPP